MGQIGSSVPPVDDMRQPAEPLVVVNRIAGRGALPISCRYTSSRTLQSDYVLQHKPVGSGMSGPVQLVTGRGDGRQYAVKSFRKRGMSAKNREELKSEAEIYLSLDHPHVARLGMVYETEDELHFVMEYLQGGELYDRLAERRTYTEEDAAEAMQQMLLAVAYLHAHRIAHRDIKLENFLYESRDSNLLKIIDFGFAKFTEHCTTMSQACGSIHYVAPEVLAHSYTEKADLWSLGVIAYMLLIGSPPFSGSDDDVLRKIKSGQMNWPTRCRKLSAQAQDFIRSLLRVDPERRLSAQEALNHPWIAERHQAEVAVIDSGTLESLRNFSRASQFRRNVLSMMAWSLSTDDRLELRKQFLSIDTDMRGTISLKEFKDVLEKSFDVGSTEAERIFKSLDTDHNDEVEYSEFLAAALLGHLKVHGDVLRATFQRLVADGDGKIGRLELRRVLGDTFSDEDIQEVLWEADTSGDGKLDYEDFLAYFHKPEVGAAEPDRLSRRRRHTEKLGLVIDGLLQATKSERALPELAPESDSLRRWNTDPINASRRLPMLLGNLRSSMRGGNQK